jgi:hypothetical protein
MSDARKLLVTRAIRGLADGVVSVALATYLTHLGFGALAVGAIVTGTLLGSAAVTLASVSSAIAGRAGGCCSAPRC